MKFFFLIILLILISNCSFDNKTGIWKNEQNKLSVKKDNGVFKDFQNINLSKNRNFDQIIEPEKKIVVIKPLTWVKVHLKKNDICGVICDRYYEENDYIHDIEKFNEIKNSI